MPFLDGKDVFAGAAIEALLRKGRRLEYTAPALAGIPGARAGEAAARARSATARRRWQRSTVRTRSAAEWAPRLLKALRKLGWPGSRPLRSDEQQTVARWQSCSTNTRRWVPGCRERTPRGAVATLRDLARERNFDPGERRGPGDADRLARRSDRALRRHLGRRTRRGAMAAAAATGCLHSAAHCRSRPAFPRRAPRGRRAWRAHSLDRVARRAPTALVCSWARLEGDAHRSAEPVARARSRRADMPATRRRQHARRWPAAAAARATRAARGRAGHSRRHQRRRCAAASSRSRCRPNAAFMPMAKCACGAEPLEAPAPGIDPRERGMLLHKALELVWIKLDGWFEPQWHRRAGAPADDRQIGGGGGGIRVSRLRADGTAAGGATREASGSKSLIEALLEARDRRARPSTSTSSKRAARSTSPAADSRCASIASTAIEGGGYAILDYKSGEPRALRWDGEKFRDPQLLAYLLAERGRNVQALANVSLTQRPRDVRRQGLAHRAVARREGQESQQGSGRRDRCRLAGGASEQWLQRLRSAGGRLSRREAPVQPAPDVCRNCHLTVLCRRVELAAADLSRVEAAHDVTQAHADARAREQALDARRSVHRPGAGGLGQDHRAHAALPAPAGHGRGARAGAGDHVHAQGRRRNARARAEGARRRHRGALGRRRA